LHVAPSRHGANSVASSSASQRSAAEARLRLAEAQHDLALAEARESALTTAVMSTGVAVRKQQYEVELARSSGSRSASKAGSVVSVASTAKPSDTQVSFAQRLAALSASPPSGRTKPAGHDLAGDDMPVHVQPSSSSSSRPWPHQGGAMLPLPVVPELFGVAGKPAHQETKSPCLAGKPAGAGDSAEWFDLTAQDQRIVEQRLASSHHAETEPIVLSYKDAFSGRDVAFEPCLPTPVIQSVEVVGRPIVFEPPTPTLPEVAGKPAPQNLVHPEVAGKPAPQESDAFATPVASGKPEPLGVATTSQGWEPSHVPR